MGTSISKITPILRRRVEVFDRQRSRFLLEVDEARGYVEMGWARRISRYRIQLTTAGENAIKAAEISTSDLSARPGPWLPPQVVAKKPVALAILAAWQPAMVSL